MSDLEDILDGISSDSSSGAPSESSDSHSQSRNSGSQESNDLGPESSNPEDGGEASDEVQ